MNPRDKEFPKLTVKQADFYRAWQKKCVEKGGEKPKYNEIEGYLYSNARGYVRVLIHKGFLAESLQTPFRKSDAEFPDIGERSANVLRSIKKYIAEHGIAPSMKEISGHATPGVTYGVHECLTRLIRAGYIQKQPKISRGIRLTDKAFSTERAWERAIKDKDFCARFLNESDDDFRKRIAQSPVPGSRRDSVPELGIPMRLNCPECRELHIDEGEFATKPHHTHACQACGHVWRPAIVPTTGVRFLPGFKTSPGNAETP